MRRSGFTMLELLIVLAIIAILVSISFAVYGSALESARVTATHRTITELQLAVDARHSALQRQNVHALAQRFQTSYEQGNNSSPAPATIPLEIAQIMVQKDRYRQALPTRLEDLWGFDGTPGTFDDSPLWGTWKRMYNKAAGSNVVTDATPRPTGHRRDLENTELLHLFLVDGGAFGSSGFSADRIPARHKRDTPIDLNGDGTVDATGNGIIEFVDDWGNPLRFYGWTHRLMRAGGNGAAIDRQLFMQSAYMLATAQSLPATPDPFPANIFNHPVNQDSDDPTGALAAAMTATNVFAATFRLDHDVRPGPALIDIHDCPPFDEDNYHALDTRSVSLIMSAGPDGVLGLAEPTEATNPAQRTGQADPTRLDTLTDNVTVRH